MKNSSLVECSKIEVKLSPIKNAGLGAFLNTDVVKDEIIEKGVVRIIPIDGNIYPYCFTWSYDRKVWGIVSGCATFYNHSNNPNVRMVRNFIDNTFYMQSLKDIKKGEELTHSYKSIDWRKCFTDIKPR